MKIYIYLLLIGISLAALDCAAQDTIYVARQNDGFLMSMERTNAFLSEKYVPGKNIQDGLAAIRIKYIVERSTIIKQPEEADRRALALSALQKSIVHDIGRLLPQQLYEIYTDNLARFGEEYGHSHPAGTGVRRRNAASLAYRETLTMRERYGLSDEQFARLYEANKASYEQIAEISESTGERRISTTEETSKLQRMRQVHIRSVLNPEQYGAYNRDMGAMEAHAKREMEIQRTAREKQMKSQKP